MKTVIMAGGKGTRIAKRFPDIPKPLIPIEGVPVLEREIISLRDQGYTDITLTISHMAQKIIDYFSERCLDGVNLDFYVENEPLGNAGALFKMKDKLNNDFLLLNADNIFDVNFDRFVKFHKAKRAKATIFTHPNNHPYDSGLIITDNDGRIVNWLNKEDKRPIFYKNKVNAGIHIISPELLKETDKTKVDLDRDILKPFVSTGMMYSYDSSEYVEDMGTPERYEAVLLDFKNGIVGQKNLRNRQNAIFLDRDGTINKYVGFLKRPEEFELLPRAAEAIKAINKSGYLAIVVTNQPVVARGDVTFGQLDEIHNKMETLLGEQGAYVDDIYYCPHHPDLGFEGEIRKLKIECTCRKPSPGMLLKAADKYNIDLSKSWMIGDDERDIQAGKNAGCRTAFIGDNLKISSDLVCNSLLDAVNNILK